MCIRDRVTVHPSPVAKFEPKQDGNQLILTNNSTGATSFVWNVNGEKFERDNANPFVIELDSTSPATWRISLEAISKFCGSDQTKVISFKIKPIEPPADDCSKIATENILKDFESLQTVSYTHLDVYKRQVHMFWLITLMTGILGFLLYKEVIRPIS